MSDPRPETPPPSPPIPPVSGPHTSAPKHNQPGPDSPPLRPPSPYEGPPPDDYYEYMARRSDSDTTHPPPPLVKSNHMPEPYLGLEPEPLNIRTLGCLHSIWLSDPSKFETSVLRGMPLPFMCNDCAENLKSGLSIAIRSYRGHGT